MKRKIFAVLGVMPEPGGYAIAKFSRTPVYKSYQDWVMELTEEGAEKFYNTFYFEYGHSSIADLAHLMVVFENISVPARNLLLDEPLIDVQSRSTRYVDYAKCNLITPPEIKNDRRLALVFRQACCQLIKTYSLVQQKVAELYVRKYGNEKPADMDEETFIRTTKARSFDVARYFLPGAIPKSMGVIASARTWERIITKFLSSDLAECRQIGRHIQKAICRQPAFNPLLAKINGAAWLNGRRKAELKKIVTGKNIGLPTLVKYSQAKDYPAEIYRRLNPFLTKLDLKNSPDGQRGVELHQNLSPMVDLATSVFYRMTPHSYGQIMSAVRRQKKEFLDKVAENVFCCRGEHDELVREAKTGGLIFDICMDIGGFRDLHRHRNCVQILKEPRWIYGFDQPSEIGEVGLSAEYQRVMDQVREGFTAIEKKFPGVGQYLLPQAARRRFLMKMTPWELQYIAELRTKPQGHISYREIAYKMYLLFRRRYPGWAKYFRVTDYRYQDFFKR